MFKEADLNAYHCTVKQEALGPTYKSVGYKPLLYNIACLT
jgi:hypothetical protein